MIPFLTSSLALFVLQIWRIQIETGFALAECERNHVNSSSGWLRKITWFWIKCYWSDCRKRLGEFMFLILSKLLWCMNNKNRLKRPGGISLSAYDPTNHYYLYSLMEDIKRNDCDLVTTRYESYVKCWPTTSFWILRQSYDRRFLLSAHPVLSAVRIFIRQRTTSRPVLTELRKTKRRAFGVYLVQCRNTCQ